MSDAISFRVDGSAVILVRQLFQGKLNADVRPGWRRAVFRFVAGGGVSSR